MKTHYTHGNATHGRTLDKVTSGYGRQFCGWRPLEAVEVIIYLILSFRPLFGVAQVFLP